MCPEGVNASEESLHARCLALQHTHSPVADCKPRPSQRDGRGCPGQWVAVTRASIAWSISYYYKVVSWRLCLAVAELGTFATLFVSRRAVRSSLLPPSRPRCLFVCVSLRKDCFRFRRPPALQCKSEWGDDGELVVRVSMRESKFKYSRRHAYPCVGAFASNSYALFGTDDDCMRSQRIGGDEKRDAWSMQIVTSHDAHPHSISGHRGLRCFGYDDSVPLRDGHLLCICALSVRIRRKGPPDPTHAGDMSYPSQMDGTRTQQAMAPS